MLHIYMFQDGAYGQIVGHYILSSHPLHAPQIPHNTHNAPILIECKILRHVVASATEAETVDCFTTYRKFYICVSFWKQLDFAGQLRP